MLHSSPDDLPVQSHAPNEHIISRYGLTGAEYCWLLTFSNNAKSAINISKRQIATLPHTGFMMKANHLPAYLGFVLSFRNSNCTHEEFQVTETFLNLDDLIQ